jgi:rubrerythrin
MAPKLLQKPEQADAAAGQELPLATTVHQISIRVHHLQQQLQTLRQSVDYTKKLYEKSTMQAIMFALWPTEAVAVRRGVQFSRPNQDPTNPDLQAKLQELLDREMAHVDRVERMPSPYLWQVLEEMEQRLTSLKTQMESLNLALEQSKQIPTETVNITAIVKLQEQSIWKVASALANVHSQLEQVRHAYRMYEKGANVLELADQEDREHQQQLDHQMRLQMVKNMPTTTYAPGAPAPPAPGGSIFGSAPSPGGGIFGSAPAPSSGGLFGSAPAAAPGGSLFGSTPPASGGGSLFGSAPAPAPGGSLFGSAPAPAPGGGLFGALPPTPAPAGGLFGAPAPTPAPGGGLFGAPAPTPAPGGGLFGAPAAPAPAGGLFGNTAPSSTSSTPKSKNKSRSSRRR